MHVRRVHASRGDPRGERCLRFAVHQHPGERHRNAGCRVERPWAAADHGQRRALDGNDAFRIDGGGTVSVGLAGANLVQDMIVTGFVTGIRDVDNVESNIIGTDALSTPGLGNGTGVELLTRNAGVIDNTISGNGVGLKPCVRVLRPGQPDRNRARRRRGARKHGQRRSRSLRRSVVIVQAGQHHRSQRWGGSCSPERRHRHPDHRQQHLRQRRSRGSTSATTGRGNGGATPTDPGPPERANGGQNTAVPGVRDGQRRPHDRGRDAEATRRYGPAASRSTSTPVHRPLCPRPGDSSGACRRRPASASARGASIRTRIQTRSLPHFPERS